MLPALLSCPITSQHRAESPTADPHRFPATPQARLGRGLEQPDRLFVPFLPKYPEFTLLPSGQEGAAGTGCRRGSVATGMLQLWEPQQLSQMKAGVRKKPPSPTRAPWAGQGAHRGSPACSKHRQVPRCHSCALVPGRAGGQPAPLALPWLCLSVTQQPAEERRGTGARCWLCFHSLDPGAPLTRGRGQGSSWHCPRGTQSKEGQEGQADACTILALGWGLCGSTTASCSCFPSWEGHEHMETCMDTHGNAWKRMDTHGNTWTYMETYGHTWTHMEIHGNTWKCVGTNGNALKHMDTHGNLWTYMEMHGNAWTHMDTHGNA